MAASRGASEDLATTLGRIVGPAHVLSDPEVVSGYTMDWTRRWEGPAALVVRPGSTAEVARVVVACGSASVPIVPQGGNTGLVGGSVPSRSEARHGPPIVLHLARLSGLEPVDEEAAQVTAGAGVTLAALQQYVTASGAGLALAVDLGARDRATIGGMVATNAGGSHVIRYGAMRQQVVGLEAVLADGSVISRMAGLLKDNCGYDLPGLLTGSEGTLGIVTRARLRLVPALGDRAVALVGVDGTGAAVRLVVSLRRSLGSLEAAEVFYHDGLALVCDHAGVRPPFRQDWPAYLLVECAGPDDGVTEQLAAFLDRAGLAEESTAVATDGPGRQRLWAYRERHTEAVNALGVPHKLDVTLPLGRLAEFEGAVRDEVKTVAPGAAVVMWGHVGDGNLHVNVVGPAAEDDSVDDAVLQMVARMGGSISAEHGIGRAKVRWLHLTRTGADLSAMAAIKAALDPDGLFNPGVLFPQPPDATLRS